MLAPVLSWIPDGLCLSPLEAVETSRGHAGAVVVDRDRWLLECYLFLLTDRAMALCLDRGQCGIHGTWLLGRLL